MTTIAYRDGILAADTLIVSGQGLRSGYSPKVFSGVRGIGGVAGKMTDLVVMRDWLDNSADDDFPPLSDKSDGIFISPDGKTYYCSDTGMCEFQDEFAVCGAGSKIAMGAMAMGATAEQAVGVAISLDVDSGGEITTVGIEGLVKTAQPIEQPESQFTTIQGVRRELPKMLDELEKHGCVA